MTHLGLFEGIGGFSLAARWMGWETLAWCEIDIFCQKVLKYHFPNAEGFTDIKATDFTKYANRIDILTGGFPCQPYSQAGKRKGKEDERHLWPEMLRAIREIQPRWVVGENVFGLINWSGGLVFHEVQSDLEAAGYQVFPYVLPACGVNAPHRRDRVWFIAYACGARKKCDNRTNGKTTGEIWREKESDLFEPFFDIRLATDTDNKRLQRSENIGSIRGITQKRNKQFAGLLPSGWQNFPTQSPICGGNDGIPHRLDGITFSKWRNESIKAYGNAVVPHVVYQIFKAIEQYEQTT